jgi:hypothetical protein
MDVYSTSMALGWTTALWPDTRVLEADLRCRVTVAGRLVMLFIGGLALESCPRKGR